MSTMSQLLLRMLYEASERERKRWGGRKQGVSERESRREREMEEERKTLPSPHFVPVPLY